MKPTKHSPKRQITSALLLGAAVMATSTTAYAGCNANESYIGEVCLTAATYCPKGTLEANGQLLVIEDNVALFSLLNTTYGGNGVKTFALPDLRGRVPVGTGQGPGLSNVVQGQQRGSETINQTAAQMAPHSHEAIFTPNASDPAKVEVSTATAITSKPAEKNIIAEPNTGNTTDVNLFAGSTPAPMVPLGGVSGGTNTGGTVTVRTAGEGRSMGNISPQLGLKYCIVTTGLYPVRAY